MNIVLAKEAIAPEIYCRPGVFASYLAEDIARGAAVRVIPRKREGVPMRTPDELEEIGDAYEVFPAVRHLIHRVLAAEHPAAEHGSLRVGLFDPQRRHLVDRADVKD